MDLIAWRLKAGFVWEGGGPLLTGDGVALMK